MYLHRPLIEEQTINYHGVNRLILKRPPWRLVVSLKGVTLSNYGLITDLDRRDLADGIDSECLEELVREDFDYHLQLEGPTDNLASPVVRAKLAAKEKTSTGLRLGFEFLESSEDLELFFEDLVKQTPI